MPVDPRDVDPDSPEIHRCKAEYEELSREGGNLGMNDKERNEGNGRDKKDAETDDPRDSDEGLGKPLARSAAVGVITPPHAVGSYEKLAEYGSQVGNHSGEGLFAERFGIEERR